MAVNGSSWTGLVGMLLDNVSKSTANIIAFIYKLIQSFSAVFPSTKPIIFYSRERCYTLDRFLTFNFLIAFKWFLIINNDVLSMLCFLCTFICFGEVKKTLCIFLNIEQKYKPRYNTRAVPWTTKSR